MILKSISLKKLALRTAASKAYISGRVALSPAYQSAKERAQKYAPTPLGVGLYGTSLIAGGKIGKYSYRLSQIYGSAEIPIVVLNIIQKAYQSESFYKASWKIKSRILAKNILRSPVIQRNIGETILSAIIYEIIHRNKNKQGNDALAVSIIQRGGLKLRGE